MEDNSDNVDCDSLQLKDTTDTLQSRLENTEAKLRAVEHDHSMDLETALIKLEEVCLSTWLFININLLTVSRAQYSTNFIKLYKK